MTTTNKTHNISLFLLMVFLLVLGQITKAQNKTTTKTADQILKTASSNYQSKSNIYFHFRVIGSSQSPTNGDFYCSKNKYILQVLGNNQLCDGTKIYNINKEDMEITTAKFNESQSTLNPISYLTDYQKKYQAQLMGTTKIGTKTVQIIKMTPIDTNKSIKYALLYLDVKNAQLLKLEQISSDNSKTSIDILSYKENQKLATDFFTFKKENYPNYLITEL